ncbi:hypothetical protein [Falsirhodobacter deserti]|uniref:hypothetical protein n=1 Tax=Falsirhodobacter deserti TaxID=1365611 RepID=UPI000FE3DC9E|nr:hypothetical protein [Falsirhodobacter deserti]
MLQIDHEKFGAQLAQLGYIDTPERRAVPTEKDFSIAFERFKKRSGQDVIFRPADVPIEEAIAHTL